MTNLIRRMDNAKQRGVRYRVKTVRLRSTIGQNRASTTTRKMIGTFSTHNRVHTYADHLDGHEYDGPQHQDLGESRLPEEVAASASPRLCMALANVWVQKQELGFGYSASDLSTC